jgi:hypothetical protein
MTREDLTETQRVRTEKLAKFVVQLSQDPQSLPSGLDELGEDQELLESADLLLQLRAMSTVPPAPPVSVPQLASSAPRAVANPRTTLVLVAAIIACLSSTAAGWPLSMHTRRFVTRFLTLPASKQA